MLAIDTVLSVLLRCHHRRLTRPITPMNANGDPQGKPCVICLDCGARFAYDSVNMRMGSVIGSDGTPNARWRWRAR